MWGFDFHGDPNIVETYISYLRKKIDDRDPALIHTIRRVRLHPATAQGRMSLQKRLVGVVALLLVVGLLVADVVIYASVRSFLYGQADNTLAQNEALRFQLPDLRGRAARAGLRGRTSRAASPPTCTSRCSTATGR